MTADTFSRLAAAAVGFVCGSMLTASVGVAGLVWAWGLWAPSPHEPPPEAPAVYSREQFNEMVMGRAEEEVLKVAGKPDATSQDADTKYWHYFKRTKGRITGELDDDAQVVLRGGKAIAVNY